MKRFMKFRIILQMYVGLIFILSSVTHAQSDPVLSASGTSVDANLAQQRASIDILNVVQFGNKPQTAVKPDGYLPTSSWQDGPAVIQLNGPIKLMLPEGYRYRAGTKLSVSPNHISPHGNHDGLDLSMPLVEPEDGRWVAQIMVAKLGYIPTDHLKLDPERLAEVIVANSRGSYETEDSLVQLDWIVEPVWDAQHQLVEWSYGLTGATDEYDDTLQKLNSIDRTVFINSMLLGRTYAVALQIVNADTYQVIGQIPPNLGEHPLAPLLGAIQFDQGARYSDHRFFDSGAALGLNDFITGGPPPSISKFHSFASKSWWHVLFSWRMVSAYALLLTAILRLLPASRSEESIDAD
jgi:uncharacterized membrane-anchored protein